MAGSRAVGRARRVGPPGDREPKRGVPVGEDADQRQAVPVGERLGGGVPVGRGEVGEGGAGLDQDQVPEHLEGHRPPGPRRHGEQLLSWRSRSPGRRRTPTTAAGSQHRLLVPGEADQHVEVDVRPLDGGQPQVHPGGVGELDQAAPQDVADAGRHGAERRLPVGPVEPDQLPDQERVACAAGVQPGDLGGAHRPVGEPGDQLRRCGRPLAGLGAGPGPPHGVVRDFMAEEGAAEVVKALRDLIAR
ncbi:hypothetical protein SAMN05661080_04527 [Modestobacter sp. DSM 44400]|uniref:hypothetical protein n=1 Tax=Modestobacter sp. DSM 44400 TaxID=1550230 RepID=UPI000897FBB0|nr:hypothetical protein [Modestobacter sp. DSM 44400]SDY76208.1 hypothetical protein SAMN05661080_04527 [Modestobacter sp. DSM 44400]